MKPTAMASALVSGLNELGRGNPCGCEKSAMGVGGVSGGAATGKKKSGSRLTRRRENRALVVDCGDGHGRDAHGSKMHYCAEDGE